MVAGKLIRTRLARGRLLSRVELVEGDKEGDSRG